MRIIFFSINWKREEIIKQKSWTATLGLHEKIDSGLGNVADFFGNNISYRTEIQEFSLTQKCTYRSGRRACPWQYSKIYSQFLQKLDQSHIAKFYIRVGFVRNKYIYLLQ